MIDRDKLPLLFCTWGWELRELSAVKALQAGNSCSKVILYEDPDHNGEYICEIKGIGANVIRNKSAQALINEAEEEIRCALEDFLAMSHAAGVVRVTGRLRLKAHHKP